MTGRPRPDCLGSGQAPRRVVSPARTLSGGFRELPGRGICPVCGRDVGYRHSGGIARHKPARGQPI